MSPQPSVAIWGTGTPRREFMYSDDLADACVFLMERHDAKDIGELINIGVGEDHTIREIAEMVQGAVGFTGRLHFDASKPDGTPQKLLDVSRMAALGWRAKTGLMLGLQQAYRDFLERVAAPARASGQAAPATGAGSGAPGV